MLNRRDIAYTIISRFEIELRSFISHKLEMSYSNFTDGIPTGIKNKALERGGKDDFFEAISLLDETDFPDLMEICSTTKNYKDWINFKIKKEDFISTMSSLYNLRCKIAHVKGNFNSIDLDRLMENSKSLSFLFNKENSFNELINNIEENKFDSVVTTPLSFYSNPVLSSIPNNLPFPDYEYEGGFVGRDEDKKNLSKLLLGPKFPVVTITGAGGVGKSSLALNVLEDITTKNSQKFDAVIWLSAKENVLSPMGIEDIEPSLKSYDEMLSIILEVLGFLEESKIDNIDDKEKVVNDVISLTNKILVVVDNLETVTDERIVNFIIDAPMNVKFLVTSRRGIGQIEIRQELAQLKEIEAVYLFRQIANDKNVKSLLKLEDRIIKKYVNKVSCYPLAIKWLIGQIARGKDINKVIDSIHESSSDISKFCFDQIFNDLSEDCHLVLFSLACLDEFPSAGVLEFIVGIEHERFEDAIEELVLVSLVIPEQYKNEQQEIARKFTILSLTKSYIRHHLSKRQDLKIMIDAKIGQVQNTLTVTEKAKREYRYSLNNIGAVTSEEKIAAILLQAANQKYHSSKMYEAATEDYKNASNIAPRFSSVYRNWAVMESQEGHIAEAEKLIEKAQELNNSDPQIWLIWGNILKRARRFPEALIKYEQAHKLTPTDNIILNAYGQANTKLGEYEKADRLLRSALSTDESYSKKHEIITRSNLVENLIGWSHTLQKDRNSIEAENKLTESLTHAEKALQLDIRDRNSQTNLYKALLMNGHLFKKTSRIQKAYLFYSTLNSINITNDNIVGSMFCASGAIELTKYYLDYGEMETAKSIIDTVSERFTHIYKRFPNIYDEVSLLVKTLDDLVFLRGYISRVSSDMQFVIITDNNTEDQYYASVNNFGSLPEGISDQLLNKRVDFIPYVIRSVRGENRKARNVSFVE